MNIYIEGQLQSVSWSCELSVIGHFESLFRVRLDQVGNFYSYSVCFMLV